MTRAQLKLLTLFDIQLIRNRALLTAMIGHLSVDLCSGMMPLVLILQKDALGLSYEQLSYISITSSLAGSFSQPFFGWLGDRWGYGRLMVMAVAIACLAMPAMFVANIYVALILLALCAGLASGAFHPQGAVIAGQSSIERRGGALSIFMLGGNLGFATGSLVATAVLMLAGAYMPALLAGLGLVLSLLVYWLSRGGLTAHLHRPHADTASQARAALSLAVTVTLVVFFRSWTQSTVSTYIAQFYKADGGSTAMATVLLSIILYAIAIGGLFGGTVSDMVGRRRVLIVSTAMIGPALWGVLHTDGILPFIISAVLGLSIGASVPVSIVMTQDLVPRGKGLMSGFAMGLQFVSGAIGVWVTGILADQIGLAMALSLTALVPICAAILAFFLPRDRPTASQSTLADLSPQSLAVDE